MLRPKPVGSLIFLPLGAVSAAIGLLPWLITVDLLESALGGKRGHSS
jgi:hypothetical protein